MLIDQIFITFNVQNPITTKENIDPDWKKRLQFLLASSD